MALTTDVYWENIFSTRMWGKYPPEELIRFIARRFGSVLNKTDINILEVGCGPGPNIWFLKKEGYSVSGIDGSSTAIHQAKQRIISEGLCSDIDDIDLKVGNFASLPWPDNKFDAIVDIEAIYANPMATIKATISDICRTLKPDGLFFGKMFGRDTTGSESGEAIEPGTIVNPSIGPCAGNAVAHFFVRQEIIDLFSCFRNLQIDTLSRTDGNGVMTTSEWIVVAMK